MMIHDRLSADELQRYARQLALPEFGPAAQRRLKHAAVLCLGAGGLGSPAAMYLAAAGVGRLGIVDPDVVDRSNLHRQILHGEAAVGQAKTASAAARLRDLNPHVEVVVHPQWFGPENALAIAGGYDVLLDGSDNFPTRFLANDTAFFLGIPNIYASVHRFAGQLTVFHPAAGGPCLRCLMPSLPAPDAVPSCAEAGVLGVVPGILGCLQALETIKLLAGLGTPALGRMLHIDALTLTIRELRLARDPSCRLCGAQPQIDSPDTLEARAVAGCATGPASTVPELTPAQMAARLLQQGNDILVADVRTAAERAAAAIPGSQLIDLNDPAGAVAALLTPPAREIIVYCAVGVRSLHAANRLLDAGFQRVSHLAGGIRAWLDDGRPVTRSPAPKP